MADYTKPSVRDAWAESNVADPSFVQDPGTGFSSTGWPFADTAPWRQYWNWLLNRVDAGMRYFMQLGLVEWDAAESYRVGSRVLGDDGRTYRSITAGNVGNLPSTSAGSWEVWGFTVAQIAVTNLSQPNPPVGDSTQRIATTSWVQGVVAGGSFDPSAINAHLTLHDGQIATLQGEVASDEGRIATLEGRANATDVHQAVQDAQIAALGGGFPRTTNANGTFRINPDGTIEAWGVSVAAATGRDSAVVAIAFPNSGSQAFTVPPHIVCSPDNVPGGSSSGDFAVEAHPLASTVTTAGFSAYVGTAVVPGGGGSDLANAVRVNWRAIGW